MLPGSRGNSLSPPTKTSVANEPRSFERRLAVLSAYFCFWPTADFL
jgi:hypothetical protein